MKRILGGLMILALCSGSASAIATCNLVATVQTPAGTPIPGARVVALFFNNGQPDSSASKVATADAAGKASFCTGVNVLTSGNFYQVVASSNGYAPSIVDQFNNGTAVPFAAATAVTQASAPTMTITLDNTGVSNVGMIQAAVTGATFNTVLFGQAGLQSGGGASAYGFGTTDGTGAGTMIFDNVSYAAGGTYQVSAFDTGKNKAAGSNVSAALAAGTPQINSDNPLNFNTAPPPIANLSQTQQSGQGGNLSLTGYVVDSNGNPLQWVGLNFQSAFKDSYNQVRNDWRGAQTDQNGAFQLYDLNPNTTYYTSIMGGCSPNGSCWQGFQSTANAGGNFGAVPGKFDFLFVSSSVNKSPTYVMPAATAGNGQMAVYVQDQYGNPFPQAGVGLWPDGMPWQTTGGALCTGNYSWNPGFKNANTQATTGYALLTGLPSGNYQLSVWTPYGQVQFNGGADGQQSYQSVCTGSNSITPPHAATGYAVDDRRLTIDTSSVSGMVGVYDVYGNIVSSGTPSLKVTVTVSTNSTGLITGTLTFPSAVNDLSQSPITIAAYSQCVSTGACSPGGGFAVFKDSLMPQTTTYTLHVSSGMHYWINILSKYWGPIYAGGNQPQPDLTVSSTAVMNLQFGKAGRILGSLRKPDGSIYLPPSSNNGGSIWINAEGQNSWGGTQINNDGSFAIGGLLPGAYTLHAQNNGSTDFPYTAKQPAPQVLVNVLQDSNQDLNTADAVDVRPIVSTSSLPGLKIYVCPQNFNGDCPPQDWKVYSLPKGTPMAGATAVSFLTKGGEASGVFSYQPTAGQANRCNGQTLLAPGFCSSAVAASKAGSAFDFYLVRAGGFDSAGLQGGVRPYFVIENTTSAIVGPKYVNNTVWSPFGGMSGSTTTVEDINVTPTVSLANLPQAVVAGTVTAVNMINQRQFQALGGNFDGFLAYLPVVWIYDTTGTLKATGLVVPFPPAEKNKDILLNQSVASGDFSAFTALTGAGTNGWGALGYEIRGLTANTTYNMVVTTPNYPPFKTTILTGVAASTTSLDVNLDLNPGTSLSGVVQSTATAAIAGAQVTVKAPGYAATTLTTDANGAWGPLNGLAAGRYQVTAVAAGFAQQSQLVDVNASPVTVPTFSLPASNAAITGVVYTNNPVCPPGVTCSAFGKTVLQGMTVLAYDDTVNVNNPSASLPLYRSVTDSSGVYRLDGLVSGDSYKLFVKAPSYYVTNVTTVAVAGTLTGVDFSLKPRPLDVDVFGHVVGSNYEFQILNFMRFSNGKAYISASPFAGILAAGTTDVSTGFVQRPDASGVTQLFLDYPIASLTSGVNYVLHIEAQPNDPRQPKVIKEVPFGLDTPNGTCQAVDQALIGDDSGVNAMGLPNNQVPLDISGSGDGSGLTLPAGSVLPSISTAIPSMCMSQANVSSATVGTSALRTSGVSLASFLSGVYTVSMSSVSYNPKGVDLTLSYKQSGTDIADAAIFYYDTAALKWKSVPGVQTIDPVRGTISVKGLKTLASVLDTRKAAAMGLMSVSDGKSYRPSASSVVDSGQFAILRPSQVSGGAFTGTTLKIFNFPNPFSLQTKTVSTASGMCPNAAQNITTDGTVIKYEIPAGISGTGVIRIYTPSGRLVREVDAGNISPGTCYYTTWDGRNSSGGQVANGVYYGILSVGGSKQSSGTFKLAVIK